VSDVNPTVFKILLKIRDRFGRAWRAGRGGEVTSELTKRRKGKLRAYLMNAKGSIFKQARKR